MKLFQKAKLIILRALLLIILSTSCKSSLPYLQTECNSLDFDGYISLIIWNHKLGNNYKFEVARKEALYAILYSGVSGSNNCQTQPPILNSPISKSNFSKIEKDFFSNKGEWSRYVRSGNETEMNRNLLSEGVVKTYNVIVDKKSLRKFLEDKNVLNTLNNGF